MESVLELLDRLETLITRGGAVPLTDKRMVDEKEAVALLKMIRARLPHEMSEAHRLRVAAEQLLHRAQEEARTIVVRAQEHSARLAEEHEVVQQAQRKADEILERARASADDTQRGAEDYARQVLDDLEQGVLRILMSIRKGKQLLDERQHR
ncbi:MAG: hypothetical protein QN135_07130 [Armatimonadota bacterium]|nr:hypothetical protein [Armatimonadota bacterium]